MNSSDVDVTIEDPSTVVSTRIRVGRNMIDYGFSPGITKEDRLELETMMKDALGNLEGDLKGTYYPLVGMEEKNRQQLVDDHFLFMNGDIHMKTAGMERDWPEGRGIFHNDEKTALVWVNEEDQLRLISMEKGSDVNKVFDRLCRLIASVEKSVGEKGKTFAHHERFGYLGSCPSNCGTGMRASVHVHLPGWQKTGIQALKKRCKELHLQPRATQGEEGVETTHALSAKSDLFDISNVHRLGYSEVELVKQMINGVNTLVRESKEMMLKFDSGMPIWKSPDSLVAKYVTLDV